MSARDQPWKGVRTQDEVAAIMTARGYPMGRSRVQQIELRAIEKLRRALLPLAVDLGIVPENQTDR